MSRPRFVPRAPAPPCRHYCRVAPQPARGVYWACCRDCGRRRTFPVLESPDDPAGLDDLLRALPESVDRSPSVRAMAPAAAAGWDG